MTRMPHRASLLLPLLLPLLLLSIGCAGAAKSRTYEAATQFYPVGCTNEPWRIEATARDDEHGGENLRRTVVIKINGQEALSGQISPGLDAAGQLSGTFEGHKVDATCSSKHREADNYYEVRCMLLVDDKRTVTLTF